MREDSGLTDKMAEITSPGHKLGQLIGNFFEALFADDLIDLSSKHECYCDHKGLRPRVRGNSRKVTWTDKYGNKHDLDYVIERGGSRRKRGTPVAFIELAWRRYTKHSRNKTGELEGSLLPLRESYQSCGFLGAILAGEYTEGGKKQLTSHNINVLHIPFAVLAESFKKHGVDLGYPESAGNDRKRSIIRRWEGLSKQHIKQVENHLKAAIEKEYSAFKNVLEKSLLRTIEAVVILPLYSSELVFASVNEAIQTLADLKDEQPAARKFIKYEIQIRFGNGDRVDGTFHSKDKALEFLKTFL